MERRDIKMIGTSIIGAAAAVSGSIYLWGFIAVTPDTHNSHVGTFDEHVEAAAQQMVALDVKTVENCHSIKQAAIDGLNNNLLNLQLKKVPGAPVHPDVVRWENDIKRQVREKLIEKAKCG